MITSYIQNSSVSMTKQQYFEMCEMMGSEPVDAEIPVELEDLPLEAQTALEIYNVLQDQWDSMVGRYEGKNLVNIKYIFEIWSVPQAEQKVMLDLVLLIDSIRAEEIRKTAPK